MPLSSPAEGGAPYGFIFVTTDPTLTGGGRGSAWELARHRLANGRWPLYERTPNRKRIDVGSRVACYIAGTGVNAGSIVATAIVGAVQKVGRRPVRIDPECCLTDPPHIVLNLESVSYLKKPIVFRDRVSGLSFRPENEKRWGPILMGGVRGLSMNDWRFLFEGSI